MHEAIHSPSKYVSITCAKRFFPTLEWTFYTMCILYVKHFFVPSLLYFEKVFVCGFVILFLCCFCSVVAAFISMFCMFMTYSTS
jgi:hypothetical protein